MVCGRVYEPLILASLLVVYLPGYTMKICMPPHVRSSSLDYGMLSTRSSCEPVRYRVLEFFSGIGGLRLAWRQALSHNFRLRTQLDPEKGANDLRAPYRIRPFEINETANATYALNFNCLPKCVSIEHVKVQDVDGDADVWLMSPPCQPYTKGGKQLDANDHRARAFLHLVELLRQCINPPAMIFLENVLGFEGSQSHAIFLDVLVERRYKIEEYVLSPTQIGYPNTRVRYYCLCWRDLISGGSKPASNSVLASQVLQSPREVKSIISIEFPRKAVDTVMDGLTSARCIGLFLDKETDRSDLEVPRRILTKFTEYHTEGLQSLRASYTGANGSPSFPGGRSETEEKISLDGLVHRGFRLEVVTPHSIVSGTFTKGYTTNIHRGGPLLLLDNDMVQIFEKPTGVHPSDSVRPSECENVSTSLVASSSAYVHVYAPHQLERSRFFRLHPDIRVRYFSTTELLRLHGFPEAFQFPQHIGFKKRAALIGNAVNVTVVTTLLLHMIMVWNNLSDEIRGNRF